MKPSNNNSPLVFNIRHEGAAFIIPSYFIQYDMHYAKYKNIHGLYYFISK